MMFLREMREIVAQCHFDDGADYTFQIHSESDGNLYLQATYPDTCVKTGIEEIQSTRKWKLSQHMTKSELVQTVFKLCMTSMEHRTRERFQYRGRRVFGPHFDVDALWEIADCEDVRTDPVKTP